MQPPQTELVERFAADLATLVGAGRQRIGLAVSGGPDSLAMLLLAHAADLDIAAATVDHGLRPEAAGEAQTVAQLCAALGVPHATLAVEVAHDGEGWQAAARHARYAALESWSTENGIGTLLTAHHADDQAETLLMRLARGAGLAGLAGVRPSRKSAALTIARPLLGWRKAELVAIVERAGLVPADDPSNRDGRFDRTAMRALLSNSALDPERLAASARHLAEAEDALAWTAKHMLVERRTTDGSATDLNATGLPPELVRRLLVVIFAEAGASPDGPSIDRLAERLNSGQTSTLGGLKITPGERWRFEPAPPHRTDSDG